MSLTKESAYQMLQNLPQYSINNVLDTYLSCKRYASRAISDKKLTRYERKQRYQSEIHNILDSNYTADEMIERIIQIKHVIAQCHKS